MSFTSRIKFIILHVLLCGATAQAQLNWQNVDSAFGPLPQSVHVYFTSQAVDTSPFRAYYVIADLKNRALEFTTDTTLRRRLTPAQFHQRAGAPAVVVNGTFFSFETDQNLNVVIRDGKLLSYNVHSVAGRGKDTLTYRHPFGSAIGISRKGRADIAWLATDSGRRKAYAVQQPVAFLKDSVGRHPLSYYVNGRQGHRFRKWKMHTAIGGGPVLVQEGRVRISNNEEMKFGGKAIQDKHPRTAMGYTADGKLIILAVEGRNAEAGGATLEQLAVIMRDLGCVEALNLDGGGSSCLLVNGKETIRPSDKKQRPVPAVFLIRGNFIR